MSNKLEKLVLFKLPIILFVQCTQMGGSGAQEGIADIIHIATFTPSLKVRTKLGEKKCTQVSKIGPKTNTQTNQFMVRLQAEISSNTTPRKAVKKRNEN